MRAQWFVAVSDYWARALRRESRAALDAELRARLPYVILGPFATMTAAEDCATHLDHAAVRSALLDA